jgi:hypothetical protein
MTKVFLSGSRAVSRLDAGVRERLQAIIAGGFQVLVGDAAGADKAFQRFFAQAAYPEVVVFCTGARCRNNLGDWKTFRVEPPAGMKGRAFYTLKDRRMAQDADFGFVLWDGESAGSINNLVMLARQGKKAHLYLAQEKRLRSIGDMAQVNALLAARPEAVRARIEETLQKTERDLARADASNGEPVVDHNAQGSSAAGGTQQHALNL